MLMKPRNSGLDQIGNISRPQNKCDPKIRIFVWKGRKHSWKRRKCQLPEFSPFPPTMFSKGVNLKATKSWNCLVNSLIFM